MKPTTEIPDWYEELERTFVREFVPVGSFVLEVGAGMGAVTKEILKKTNRVWSCEPQAEPFAYLKKNAQGAVCLPLAVSADGEPITLSLYEQHWAANQWHESVLGEPLDRTKVPSVHINTLLQNIPFDTIVMDAEGAEADLLRIADLRMIRCIVAEIHPYYCNPDKLEAALWRIEQTGFEQVSIERDRDTNHVAWRR